MFANAMQIRKTNKALIGIENVEAMHAKRCNTTTAEGACRTAAAKVPNQDRSMPSFVGMGHSFRYLNARLAHR